MITVRTTVVGAADTYEVQDKKGNRLYVGQSFKDVLGAYLANGGPEKCNIWAVRSNRAEQIPTEEGELIPTTESIPNWHYSGPVIDPEYPEV